MRDSPLDRVVGLTARNEELRTQYRLAVAARTVRRQAEWVPLQRLRPELESPERRRRERAWRVANARRLEDAPELSELWRSLVEIQAEPASRTGEPDAGRRVQLAIEEFVTSVLVRLHERRRRQLGLRTIRPWDLCTVPPGFPVEPLFATKRYAIVAADRAMSDVHYRVGAGLTAPYASADALESDAEVEDVLADYGEALVQATMPDIARSGREADVVARVALPLLVLHGTEAAHDEANAPTPLKRVRIRHLERRLLGWTFGAMIDAFEEWAYSHPDQVQDENVPGTIWSSLWLRFLPAVDWAGLEDVLNVDWQRHDALFLRPGESVNRISRELEVLKAWNHATDLGAWFQELGITDHAAAHHFPGATAIVDQDLLEVARWMEDTIEDLEGAI